MTTWTVPSHLCTAPGAIVSLLWVLLAPRLFLYYPGLSSTALSSPFFPLPSLTSWPLSFSSVPSLPRFRLPILCSLPSGLPTICYESSTFPWQKRWQESNDWLLCFPCSQNLGCERDLCTSGPFIASGGMCCVVPTEKDLVWLEFLGPMGKSELVCFNSPFDISKKHAVAGKWQKQTLNCRRLKCLFYMTFFFQMTQRLF